MHSITFTSKAVKGMEELDQIHWWESIVAALRRKLSIWKILICCTLYYLGFELH